MYNFLSKYFNDFVVLKICVGFVILQVTFIFLLFLFYLKNMFSRILRQYVLEKYEYYIMEAALGKVDKSSPLFKSPPFIRKILRIIILDKIMSVGGDARKGLIDLYRDMGFDSDDIKLLKSSRWYHRLSAITSLTIIKSEVLKEIISEIIKDKNLSIRVAIIKAVSALNLTKNLPDAIRCMETMPDWINERVIEIIMKIEKRLPYEEMLRLFNESSERVKRYIVPLLFESDKEQALWDLTNNFNKYDFETQIAIVKSMYKVDSIDKIIGFTEMIMDSDKWELKSQLVKSLGMIRDERAIPILIRGLDDKNWFVRFNSAVSLSMFGEKGLEMLKEFADAKAGFQSDISRYILDLSKYGFLSEETNR